MSTKILGVPVVTAILAFSAFRAFAAETDVKSAASPASNEAQAAAPLPGHSLHGEAFDEGPRQKAYLMTIRPGRACISDKIGQLGICEVWVIQDIEKLRPQIQIHPLR